MNRYIFFKGIVWMLLVVLCFVGTAQAVPAEHEGHNHEHAVSSESKQEEHQSEHKAPSLNPLEVVSDTAIWSLVIFLLVFGILGKFAFGPIAKALDEREKGIVDKIASAQRVNEEAQEILKQYQQKLDDSKTEVRQILDTARKDAQQVADGIIEKAREAAIQERDRAMREIDDATTLALQTIAERGAVLATNLAGKMIRAEVKPERHRELIHAALEEFAKN
ncbi:MAG: F0F1 ATP synthase subunit B [Planctomycetaceae bacterium]|jgi:F-type H+-transporting ATPase subunit b|nr:F0F1 ATP synthase subunit B [Planctomycetaceae bacterium]